MISKRSNLFGLFTIAATKHGYAVTVVWNEGWGNSYSLRVDTLNEASMIQEFEATKHKQMGV